METTVKTTTAKELKGILNTLSYNSVIALNYQSRHSDNLKELKIVCFDNIEKSYSIDDMFGQSYNIKKITQTYILAYTYFYDIKSEIKIPLNKLSIKTINY